MPLKKNKKSVKKTVKKTTAKTKKSTPKKVIKKVTKKPTKKVEKKPATKKKIVKKPVAKKNPAKKLSKKTSKKTPAKKVEKKPAVKTVKTEKKPISKSKAEPKKAAPKIEKNKDEFSINDFVIYPSHGIGKIIDVEKTRIMGSEFSCYLIYFEKEKLTIKVPTSNAKEVNLRHIVDQDTIQEVFSILRSGVKKMKGMWSRRAQEYEAKINSGDIFALAEVLRDLARDIDDGDRSYSERIIYETAIMRLASEYAAIYNISLEEAKEIVTNTAKDKLNSDSKEDGELLSRKIHRLDDEEEDEEYEDEEEDEDEEDDFDDDDDFDD